MFTAGFARRFGDVARLPVPFTELILLSHPDAIAHVALKAPERYERSPYIADSMRVQGSPYHASWFEADDAEWARGRELLQPHFTQKALTELGELFTEAIVDEVDRWGRAADLSGPLRMAEPLKRLALAVLYNAMFSRRISEAEMPQLLEALEDRMLATTVRTLMFSLPSRVPRPYAARGARGDRWIDEHLASLIAERRANPIATTDLLNVLLDARYADGAPLEDTKIRTEMLFLVIGGHETTAAALLATFAQLASHPDVAARVCDEVDALGDRRLGPADMAALEFTRACFDEAMRLQGGLVINPKRAVVDDVVAGRRIPAGATVIHSNLTLQQDPRFWGPDAALFNPDRWLHGATPSAAFQNFGRGRRMCLGKRMAYIEGVLTIATACQRYRFRLPAGAKLRRQYRMSMVIRGGLPLLLERRWFRLRLLAAVPALVPARCQRADASDRQHAQDDGQARARPVPRLRDVRVIGDVQGERRGRERHRQCHRRQYQTQHRAPSLRSAFAERVVHECAQQRHRRHLDHAAAQHPAGRVAAVVPPAVQPDRVQQLDQADRHVQCKGDRVQPRTRDARRHHP